MKQLSFVVAGALLLATSLATKDLQACSSCGSGGADPVILNPSESQKLYLGLGLQTGFVDINSRGDRRDSSGPEQKWLAELAFAKRLLPRLFGSVVADFGLNHKDGEQLAGPGDVTLNLRSTLIQPTMVEAALPQLQLILSQRLALGRSINESERASYMDVFGAGNNETYLGFDTWWGMLPAVFGFSYLYGLPASEAIAAGDLQQGRLHRLIVTGGAMLQAELKLIGGVVADQRGDSRLDGEVQASSAKRSQNLFVTLETLHPEADNYRVTLVRRGAVGTQQNAVEAWGLTLAWMSLL